MSKKIILNLVQTYFANMEAMNAESWLAIFALDAIIYDPVDSPGQKIHETAQEFFAIMSRFFAKLKLSQDYLFIANNEAAAKWTMKVVAKNGKTATAEGISLFTINEAGKIQQVRSYWDEVTMMAQLR